MRTWTARTSDQKIRPHRHPGPEIEPARCKAMFAELSDYLDEQLDDSFCEEFERHMAGCEPCQAFIATLKATIEQCRNSARDCPPREAAKLRQVLMEKYYRANAALRPNS